MIHGNRENEEEEKGPRRHSSHGPRATAHVWKRMDEARDDSDADIDHRIIPS
jgi:hypothetical protein